MTEDPASPPPSPDLKHGYQPLNRHKKPVHRLYRRLFGREVFLNPERTGSLWLGPDHLLLLRRYSYSEEYLRFHFSDIQALVIQITPRRLVTNLVFGGVTFLVVASVILMILLAGWNGSEFFGGSLMLLLVLLFFMGVAILGNTLLGPTCKVHLRTALKTTPLPSLTRLHLARDVVETLRERIEAAQGRLGPAQLEALAGPEPQASTEKTGAPL